jgi:hypothetical protein
MSEEDPMARPTNLARERAEVLTERNAAFASLNQAIERELSEATIERRRERYNASLRAYKAYLTRAKAAGAVAPRPRTIAPSPALGEPRQHIRVRPRARQAAAAGGARSGDGSAVSVTRQPAPSGAAGSRYLVELFINRNDGPVVVLGRRTLTEASREVRELLEVEPALRGADIRHRARLLRSYGRTPRSGRPRLVFRWRTA